MALRSVLYGSRSAPRTEATTSNPPFEFWIEFSLRGLRRPKLSEAYLKADLSGDHEDYLNHPRIEPLEADPLGIEAIEVSRPDVDNDSNGISPKNLYGLMGDLSVVSPVLPLDSEMV